MNGPTLPTFAHHSFKEERIKRERAAAKVRLGQDQMGTLFIRAQVQARAAMYLLTRPTLFIVHESKSHARRGNLFDLLWRQR